MWLIFPLCFLYMLLRSKLWLVLLLKQMWFQNDLEKYTHQPLLDLDLIYHGSTGNRTPFCFQNCLISLWHRVNRCWKHSYVDTITSHRFGECIPMMIIFLYWLDCDLVTMDWFEYSVHTVTFKKPVWEDLSSLAYCAVFRRWAHCGHKGMDTVSSNTQVGYGIQKMLSLY